MFPKDNGDSFPSLVSLSGPNRWQVEASDLDTIHLSVLIYASSFAVLLAYIINWCRQPRVLATTRQARKPICEIVGVD